MAIEIVDLPSYKMVVFHSYVSLPEGIRFGRSIWALMGFPDVNVYPGVDHMGIMCDFHGVTPSIRVVD